MIDKFFSKITQDGPSSAVSFLDVVKANQEYLTPGSALEDVLALGFVEVSQPEYPRTGKDYLPGIPQLVDGFYVGNWVEQTTPDFEIRAAIRARAVRADRDSRIAAIAWRYERIQRHARLGLPQLDTLEQLDAYVQALANVPEQSGFPFDVQWPTFTLNA